MSDPITSARLREVAIKITHISDIAKIPPENLDEFLSDMRTVYCSLALVKAALPDGADLSKFVTHLDWVAEGLGNIPPTTSDGKKLFSMRIVKDES